MWAFVGGNLNEYSLRGALLRTISKEALEAEGVRGVTSMAWTKKNGLVLGMTVGNAIAVIDTAPPEAKDQILRISMAMAGISEEFSEELEPIGQDAEDSIIRDVNLFVVDSIFTIASDLLAPDSLGAVAYNTFPGKLLFSSTDPEAAGVKEISLDGQTGDSHVIFSRPCLHCNDFAW